MIEIRNEPITKITLCRDFDDLKMTDPERREIIEVLKNKAIRSNTALLQDVEVAKEQSC